MGKSAARPSFSEMNSLVKGLLLCALVTVGAQATRLSDPLEKALLEEIATEVGATPSNSTSAPSSATTVTPTATPTDSPTAPPSVLTTVAPSNLTATRSTYSPNKFKKAGRDTRKWLEGAGKDIHGAFKSLFGKNPAPTTSPVMLFVGIATAAMTLFHA